MAFNPLGAVQVYDFGNPKVITGYARETISGGQFVYTSGAKGVVSSGLSSFASSDIQFAAKPSARTATFAGVALQTVASGAIVPVAVEGAFIVNCAGSVFSSQPIMNAGDDSIVNLGSFVVPANGEDAGAAARIIGRAITEAGSEQFAVAYLRI